MHNRLQALFSKKKEGILSVFFTAGFPNIDDTIPIALALDDAGADIIEIGIPFSDPVADGPTIQASNKVSLQNGITLKKIIDQVKQIRTKSQTPLVLMGYLNPVMQYGMEKFVEDAAVAGVDGIILPDMPVDEYEEKFKSLFERNGLGHVFLVAPTTSAERQRKIDAVSSPFIYAVSASSTTGAKKGFTDDQTAYFERLKKMEFRNPFLIGFGISDSTTFSTACRYAHGAIVGSAFINMLADSRDVAKDTRDFVTRLRGGKS